MVDAIIDSLVDLAKHATITYYIPSSNDRVWNNGTAALTTLVYNYLSPHLKKYTNTASKWLMEKHSFIPFTSTTIAEPSLPKEMGNEGRVLTKDEIVLARDMITNDNGDLDTVEIGNTLTYVVFIKNVHVRHQILYFVHQHYPNCNYYGKGSGNFLCKDTKTFDVSLLKNKNEENNELFDYFPVYLYQGDVVYIYCEDHRYWALRSSSCEALQNFVRHLPDINKSDYEPFNASSLMNFTSGNKVLTLHPARHAIDFLKFTRDHVTSADRRPMSNRMTFDHLVFRAKPQLIKILEKFESNAQSNSPYIIRKLGLILSGESGTGKSSVITAIANRFQRDVIVLNLKDIPDQKTFETGMRKVLQNKLIVCLDEFDHLIDSLDNLSNNEDEIARKKKIEDIQMLIKLSTNRPQRKLRKNKKTVSSKTKKSKKDVVAQSEESEEEEEETDEDDGQDMDHVQTFENLSECSNFELKRHLKKLILNENNNKMDIAYLQTFLDGYEDCSDRIIIATTNHLEKIKSKYPALLRPGRFSMHLTLSNFNKAEIIELLCLIYYPVEQADYHWLQSLTFLDNVWSPAEIMNVHYMHDDIRMTAQYLMDNVPNMTGSTATTLEEKNVLTEEIKPRKKRSRC